MNISSTDGKDSIQQLLTHATGELQGNSDSARLDAEVLLAHVLKRERSYLYTWPERKPSVIEAKHYLLYIDQRRQGVPVAYITGTKEFWSMTFSVTAHTLVPRSDTETLVQLAIDFLADNPGPVLDLGTGCGAIAISVAKELESLKTETRISTDGTETTGARTDRVTTEGGGRGVPAAIDVTATDNSVLALNVARENARRLQAPVSFYLSSWFSQLPDKRWRLIVSNPPYLAPDDQHLSTLQYEPHTALVAPENGLGDIAIIADSGKHHLQTNGALMIEHGEHQALSVQSIMRQAGYESVNTAADIAGRDRVTTGLWHG